MKSSIMFTLSNIVVIYMVVTNGKEPEIKLLSTFTGLAEVNGTSESCAFDAANNLWRIWNFDSAGEGYSLPGSYPLNNASVSDEDFSEKPALGTVALATYGVEDTMYIGTFGPYVLKYDLQNEELLQSSISTPGVPASCICGMCYDEESDTLFTTNAGFDFFGTHLPFANPSNASGDTAAAFYYIEGVSEGNTTPIRVDLTNIKDQNGDVLIETNAAYSSITGETNRVYFANHCTVVDGKVYLVETRNDGFGALGIYDIETKDLFVNTDVLGHAADGLVHIDNYLVLVAWNTLEGANMGTLEYYNLDNYPDGNFTIGYRGLSLPSNPGTNGDDIICSASFSGDIYFVQFTPPGDDTDETKAFSVYLCTFFVFVNVLVVY